MYRAFGLLTMRYVVISKRRDYAFRFDEASPLVPYICDVLAALDRAMPQWAHAGRATEERTDTQALEPASGPSQDGSLEAVILRDTARAHSAARHLTSRNVSSDYQRIPNTPLSEGVTALAVLAYPFVAALYQVYFYGLVSSSEPHAGRC
jgi:hypothetical protein